MKGLNRAYLIGNLGQEPELRTSASGIPLLKLSLATPNARKVNEEWVDTPDWHRLTVFGNDAEYLARYAHKGDTLAVECAIRPNRWTDKDNVVHYEVNLIVERVAWVGGRNRPAQTEGKTTTETRSPGAASEPVGEAEIPF